MENSKNIRAAEIRLPCDDITEALSFYTNKLGFKLEMIFPADNPSIVVLSGHGLRIRLENGVSEDPGTLRILCENPDAIEDGKQILIAPNGTRIELVDANPPLITPPTEHKFVVRRLKDKSPWIIGRAGMQYRDLIPGRLGGSIIASHIRIPDAGPVPDMVHYHTVGFQLIYCYRGWVKVVYEDQGPAITLTAGDCLVQPPEIRHRVLESGDGLQVIEIGVPAEHITTIDHNMDLPNQTINPDRIFSGQKFCFHQAKSATWSPWRMDGFEFRDSGIGSATGGVASVQVARAVDGGGGLTSHNSDILFTFVLEGTMTIDTENQGTHQLIAGDAFVIPPNLPTSFSECSEDLELLEVSLPANFETTIH